MFAEIKVEEEIQNSRWREYFTACFASRLYAKNQFVKNVSAVKRKKGNTIT